MKILKILLASKRVIAYILLNIQWITGNPMLWGALKAVYEDPSSQNIANLIAQIILATAVVDGVKKVIVASKSNP